MKISICMPILLVVSLPFFLWLLAKPPFRVIQPGLRFKCASLLILGAWCVAKGIFFDLISLDDWVAGFLWILSCLIFGFMVWSVLCWGYTLCMLLSLHEHNDSVDSDQWQKLHAGPQGTERLTWDRVHVLVKFRLAAVDGNRLVISRPGQYLAVFARLLMKIFGVKR